MTAGNSSRRGLGRSRSGPRKTRVCGHPSRRRTNRGSAANSNSRPRSRGPRPRSSRKRTGPGPSRKISTYHEETWRRRCEPWSLPGRRLTLPAARFRIKKKHSAPNSRRREVRSRTKGQGRSPQGRSRRTSQARWQGRRTERQVIRPEGPARETRGPLEGPCRPPGLAGRERGPRPSTRSGVGEGFPLGGGTSPRGGDRPEGDQRARARPREGREEIRGEATGADATGKGERGDALEGTRRSSQAASRARPRKREASQGGRGATGVRSGRQRLSRATRTRTRSRNHQGKGGA